MIDISPTHNLNKRILCCPISQQPLDHLDSNQEKLIREELAKGKRRNRDGTEVQKPLNQFLISKDGRYVYRGEDGIWWLLPALAIVRMEDVKKDDKVSGEKLVVQKFYDEFGWVKGKDGAYNDTVEFTEQGTRAEVYRIRCNRRIAQQLKGGKYLLDVASGAIPHAEYIEFSEKYEFRVCVDFSLRALAEAKKKLGVKGVYILGDISQLPIVSGVIDTVISLHTIYHVPKADQAGAVDELVRVTRPGGRVVVVYTWDRAPAMEAAFRMRGLLGWLRRGGRPSPAASQTGVTKAKIPVLFFHPQGSTWYCKEIYGRHGGELRVWSLASTAFQNRFFRGWLGGLIIQVVMFLEELAPRLAGWVGQYPMFIINKKA